MEISDAYRKARRKTSIFGGICLAWSAAQFDLNSLKIGAMGKVDISGASIPIILACVILYAIVRCTLEFMMQPKEIRRWNFAQVDYKITLNLVRISLLVVAAATASRSLETVAGVTVAALVLFFSYFLLVPIILMLVIMPIRSLQGRLLSASSALEATFYSMAIVAIFYTYMFVSLVFSATSYLPFSEHLPPIPNQISTVIFAITATLVAISFFCEGIFLRKVFAFEPVMRERKYFDKEGREIISIESNPEHPEYEKHKHQSPLVVTKVESNKKQGGSEDDVSDGVDKKRNRKTIKAYNKTLQGTSRQRGFRNSALKSSHKLTNAQCCKSRLPLSSNVIFKNDMDHHV